MYLQFSDNTKYLVNTEYWILDVFSVQEMEIGSKAYLPELLDLGSVRLITQYMKMILAIVKKGIMMKMCDLQYLLINL